MTQDNLEPIRAVFRQCGLYNHAADDLLCERLAGAVQPQVTDTMVDRALDAYQQFACGYTGPTDIARRAGMRHALQQALGVRS